MEPTREELLKENEELKEALNSMIITLNHIGGFLEDAYKVVENKVKPICDKINERLKTQNENL